MTVRLSLKTIKPLPFINQGSIRQKSATWTKDRILRAIEKELTSKGFTKSTEPDMLVSIFTKANQRVDVYNNAWGWGLWRLGRLVWSWLGLGRLVWSRLGLWPWLGCRRYYCLNKYGRNLIHRPHRLQKKRTHLARCREG